MVDPILVSIATALAGNAAKSMYDLVKQAFSHRAEARAALEAAEGTDATSAEVQQLAVELAKAEQSDAQFADQLRSLWASELQAEHGGVANQVSGSVSGKVVQARDIHGNITF
ncbi:hypothetical protein ACFCV3_30865 [Kribbella sp. NPDC056345]|uniref:hypothetical protein n=1 Tax=Kribbella sp. NPDC056345 TaxID=3345789 RepID=UPI0035DE5420